MKKEKEAFPVLPPWWTDEVVTRFKAKISSVFILHGDITCLVPNPLVDEEPRSPYIPLQEMMNRIFLKGERKMVILYNIASGPRFLIPEMEKEFRAITEMDKGDEGGKDGDPVASAKAGLRARRSIPREPELALPLIEKVLNKMDSVALIIESAHSIFPEASNTSLSQNTVTNIERLRSWAQDRRVKNQNNLVFLMTDIASKISGELRQSSTRITTVFIPKPRPEDREHYVEHLTKGSTERQEVAGEITALEKKLKKPNGKEKIEEQISELEERLSEFPSVFPVPDDFNSDVFVNATQGMSLRQILEIFRHSNQTKRPIDLFYVREKKREILNSEYGDVMEVMDPDWGLDEIGGLEHVKNYFREILNAIKRGEVRAIPQGITLMGPPGTAKTVLVEALAKDSGYNFIKMKNARSMWVGQSEERTERQITGLMALAPVVVMNDEA
ncbi:AAA family ATPase, partial [Candidatus Jorgensenbacteria bacterium]|nr:AAA family ATPase [Candidatus Jorgensenbacteria bacterium]